MPSFSSHSTLPGGRTSAVASAKKPATIAPSPLAETEAGKCNRSAMVQTRHLPATWHCNHNIIDSRSRCFKLRPSVRDVGKVDPRRRERCTLGSTVMQCDLVQHTVAGTTDRSAQVVAGRAETTERLLDPLVSQSCADWKRYSRGDAGVLQRRFPVVVSTSDDDVPSIYGLRHAASDRADWFGRAMTSPNR